LARVDVIHGSLRRLFEGPGGNDPDTPLEICLLVEAGRVHVGAVFLPLGAPFVIAGRRIALFVDRVRRRRLGGLLDEGLVQGVVAVLENDHARAVDGTDLDAGIPDETPAVAGFLHVAIRGLVWAVARVLRRADAVLLPRGPGLRGRSHVEQEEPPRVV